MCPNHEKAWQKVQSLAKHPNLPKRLIEDIIKTETDKLHGQCKVGKDCS